MKKYDVMRLSGTVLLAHMALCAAVFLLILVAAQDMTSTFTFRSLYGLALGALGTAALAFALGWGLRPKEPLYKNLCWNAAMVLYALNALAFLLAPEPLGNGPILALLWQFPMVPMLVGLDALAAPGSALHLFLGALLAAVEPLCLTLGLLSGRRAEKAAPEPTKPSAEAAEVTNDKENTPHA